MIINARHTGIVVNDLVRAEKFYSSLGFAECSRAIESGVFIDQVTGIEGAKLEWIKMNVSDGFVLELLQYHTHPATPLKKVPPANQLGCSHIAFTVECIEDTLAMICDAGGSVVNAAALAPNGKVKVAYGHDPEGVLLEIVEVMHEELDA